MSYVIQVVLSNARHPEYGQFKPIFEVEISNGSPKGYETATVSLLICFKDGTEITQAMQRRISA